MANDSMVSHHSAQPAEVQTVQNSLGLKPGHVQRARLRKHVCCLGSLHTVWNTQHVRFRTVLCGCNTRRFACPSFMVSTLTGKLLSVSSESFSTVDQDCPSGAELLLESPACSITDIAAHPLRPELLMLSSEAGQLLRWDLASRSCLALRQLSSDYKADRLVLARDGAFLVVGCAGGQLVVMKGDSLEDLVILKNTRQPITM